MKCVWLMIFVGVAIAVLSVNGATNPADNLQIDAEVSLLKDKIFFCQKSLITIGSNVSDKDVKILLDTNLFQTAELLDRYLKTRRISPFGYMGGLPWYSTSKQQKRNSELINSILGLPKVMNDAGRRK